VFRPLRGRFSEIAVAHPNGLGGGSGLMVGVHEEAEQRRRRAEAEDCS